MAINKSLAEKILKMAKIDQKIRFNALKTKDKKKAGIKIMRIDKSNTKKAQEIVKQYGWPTFNLIGKKASNAFWLIIQHADLDIKFQEECLKLLKQAVKNKQAFPQNEAYLTDRVLVNRGKKQKFGTQFIRKDNRLVPKPIFNKNNVNKRRKLYNLGTLEENIRKTNRIHQRG